MRGGRSQVRKVLYMAALVATQHNPVIQALYLPELRRRLLVPADELIQGKPAATSRRVAP